MFLNMMGSFFGSLRNVDVETAGHGPKEQVEPQAILQDSRKGTKTLSKPVFDLIVLGNSRSPFRRGFLCIQVVPFPM